MLIIIKKKICNCYWNNTSFVCFKNIKYSKQELVRNSLRKCVRNQKIMQETFIVVRFVHF